MWTFPIVVAVVGALATPSPSPSPGPLKVIVTVRSSALCSEFATHVNAAIGSAVRNDIALNGLIGTLRRPQTSDDLMDFGLRRHRAVNALVAYADALTKDWKDGEGEVNHLRDLAQKAIDPGEKVELKASADALGGALWRQRKIARDLDGFIAYLYAEEMRLEDPGPWHQSSLTGNTPQNAPDDLLYRRMMAQRYAALPSQSSSLPGDFNAPGDDVLTNRAARGFEESLPDIVRDESTAATHLLSANNQC